METAMFRRSSADACFRRQIHVRQVVLEQWLSFQNCNSPYVINWDSIACDKSRFSSLWVTRSRTYNEEVGNGFLAKPRTAENRYIDPPWQLNRLTSRAGSAIRRGRIAEIARTILSIKPMAAREKYRNCPGDPAPRRRLAPRRGSICFWVFFGFELLMKPLDWVFN